ncbi:MAG: 2-phosphosulfolactate phosphatase, partial [Solirubrobacteraceae bacterium]
MTPTVAIARYPSLGEASDDWAVVGIDVIRATTTAVTAVAAGRRCFPVATLEQAVPLAARLDNPLLVGELGGNMPYGFHLQNSPTEMDRRAELDRPVILLSSSGTPLLTEAAARSRTYA